MNALILAAQSKAAQEGDNMASIPYFFTEYSGTPLLELMVGSIAPLEPEKILYAFMKEEIDYWSLDDVISQIFPGSLAIPVENATGGAICTALLAIKHIDNDEELLIMSANEMLRVNMLEVIKNFRDRRLDAGIMVFDSIHPRYAYAMLGKDNTVTHVAERRPISRNAMPGVFWFAKGADFVKAAMSVIAKDNSLRGSYYISSSLNEYILAGAKVAAFPIKSSQYTPIKTMKQQEYVEARNFIGNIDGD